MFCTQCGTNNPEGANNCAACGAPMGTAGKKKANFDLAAMWMDFRCSKYFIPGSIGAAGLVLLLIALIFFGGSKTTPIDNCLKGVEKANASKFLSAFPKDALEELDIDKDDVQDMLDEALDAAEDEFGKNIKFKYKVTDKEKADKDALREYRTYAKWFYGLEKSKITELWTIECEVTIKGADDKDTEEMNFIVFKYKGKWYLDPSFLNVY